jgi:hypothetical protein
MKKLLICLLFSSLCTPLFSATDTSPLQNPLVFETFYSPVSMGRGMTGIAAKNSLADAIQNPASLKQDRYFNITYVAQRDMDALPILVNGSGEEYKRHHYNFFAGIGFKPHKFLDIGIAYLVPYSGKAVYPSISILDDESDATLFEDVHLEQSERLEQVAMPIKLNLNEFFSVGLTLSYFKYTQRSSIDSETYARYSSQFWHPTFGFLWDISPRLLIGGRYKPRIKGNMRNTTFTEEVLELVMPEERALGFQFVVNHKLKLHGEGVYKRYIQFSNNDDTVMDYHAGVELSPARFATLRFGYFTRKNMHTDQSPLLKTNHQSYLTAGLSLHLFDRIDLNLGYIDGDYIDSADNKKAHVSAGIEIKL